MPVIPQLERRTVNPQASVSSVSVQGASEIGRVAGNAIDSTIKEIKDSRDRYQLANASSKFSILLHQQDNAYDEDDLDYTTYVDRYNQNTTQGLSEIAGQITNPEARNQFILENQVRIASGIERVKNKAFAVETDVERGNINSRLNGLRDVILGDDDNERVNAIRDVKVLLESAKDRGYYSPEEASKVEEAFVAHAAMGYIDTLPKERQREALTSKMIKDNVPADVIARKLESITSNENLIKAQKNADQYENKSLKEQSEYLKTLSGEERELTRQQFEYRRIAKERDKSDREEKIYTDWYLPALRGDAGFTYEELSSGNNKQFNELPNQFKKDLLNAAIARKKPKDKSDPEVIDKLHELNSKKKWSELRSFYLANVGNLDSTDMDTWSKRSNEGLIPEEYEPLFQTIQLVDQELDRVGLKKESAQLVRRELQNWHTAYYKENSKNPKEMEVMEQLKRSMTKVTLDKGWLFDDTAVKVELTPEQSKELFDNTLNNPTEATPENISVIVRDVFDSSNDPDLKTKTYEAAFKANNLFEEDRDYLLNQYKKDYPERLTKVVNALSKNLNGQGIPNDLLYRAIRMAEGYED